MVHLICPISSCPHKSYLRSHLPTHQRDIVIHLVTHHGILTPASDIPYLRRRQQEVWNASWKELNEQLDDKARLRMREWDAFVKDPARGVPEEVDCGELHAALAYVAEARDDGRDENGRLERQQVEPSVIDSDAQTLFDVMENVDGEFEAGEADEECTNEEIFDVDGGEMDSPTEHDRPGIHAVKVDDERPSQRDSITDDADALPEGREVPVSPDANYRYRGADLALAPKKQPTLRAQDSGPASASGLALDSGRTGEAKASPWRRCPVPGCAVRERKLALINQHLRDVHGVPLEKGKAANLIALRARQDEQCREWCLANGVSEAIVRDQPL